MTGSVAQQISELIQTWNQREAQLRDWLGGSADGGPNNDGRYPLVDALGRETLVPSPAHFADMVEGPAAAAATAMANAGAFASAADLSAQTATTKANLAAAHEAASIAARNLAEQHRSFAGNHEANARYWAELSEGMGANTTADRIAVEQLHQEAVQAASEAMGAASDAAGSAAAAATFNPALYDLKTDTLHADRVVGVLAPDRIPVLPSQLQFASSGDLSDLTQQQQDQIGQGSIVTTTDGYRRVYSGVGSKTSSASYTILADLTPEWTSITGKPPSFPASTHGHPWTEITGKPTTFPATAHEHAWSEITGKPGYDAVLSQRQGWLTHTSAYGNIEFGPGNSNWAHIYTDRPEFYFNKPIRVNNVPVSLDDHTHSYLPLSGGSLSGSLTVASWISAATGTFSVSSSGAISGSSVTTSGAGNFSSVSASLNHKNGYFSFQPYSSSYDDGSYMRGYWSGNDSELRLFKVGGVGSQPEITLGSHRVWHAGNMRTFNLATFQTWQTDSAGNQRFYLHNDGHMYFKAANSTTGNFYFQTGAGQAVAYFYGNRNVYFYGNVQMPSFNITSDERLKSDILPLRDHARFIDGTNVYSYLKNGRKEWGPIAQEMQKGVAPFAVIEADEENEDGFKELSVNDRVTLYALLAEVKDLRVRLAEAGL